MGRFSFAVRGWRGYRVFAEANVDPSSRAIRDSLRGRPPAADTGEILRADTDTVYADGLTEAQLGEAVVFDDGGVGVVQALLAEEVRISRLTGGKATGGVRRAGGPPTVWAGPGLRGRVVDALGGPLDGRGPLREAHEVPMYPRPLPWLRRQWGRNLPCQIPFFDTFLPVMEGNNIVVAGAERSGRSTLAIDLLAGVLRAGDGAMCGVYACQSAAAGAWARATLEHVGVADRVTVVVARADGPLMARAAAAASAVAIGGDARSRGGRAVVVVDDVPAIAAAMDEAAGARHTCASAALLRALRGCASVEGEDVSHRLGSLTVIWVDTKRQRRDAYGACEHGVEQVITLDDPPTPLGPRSTTFAWSMTSAQPRWHYYIRKRLALALWRGKELETFVHMAHELDLATRATIVNSATARELLAIRRHEHVPLPFQSVRLICWAEGLLEDLPREQILPFLRTLDEHLSRTAPDLLDAPATGTPGWGWQANPALVSKIREHRESWRSGSGGA